jgi:hypothetical protein
LNRPEYPLVRNQFPWNVFGIFPPISLFYQVWSVKMKVVDRIEERATVAGKHSISSIVVTDKERDQGHLDAKSMQHALSLFARNGYIRIENLFTPDQMAAFDAQYRSRNANFLTATNKGDKRPLFTVPIEGVFNDPILLANPILEPLLSTWLGEDFIIAAVSAVASFPGAPDQHLHRDSLQLFGKDNEADKDLPPYSVTMLVPLIDFTTETGCTRVWPGSHHIAGREEGLAVGSLDPEVKVGSVLITDGRILHRGAANRSDRLRPLFYLTFHRAWFRDFGGYAQRPPLLISRAEFRRMDPKVQRRVAWFGDTFKAIKRKYWIRKLLPASIRLRIAKDS